MNDYLIKVDNLSMSRNDTQIFSNISFELFPSHIINIFGKNGTGKTTLLKILIGLTEQTNGTRYIKTDIENYDENIIYIGHKDGLKNELTIQENLIFFQRFNMNENHLKINVALEKFKMSKYKNTQVKNLSHGQKKCVSLMKTIITDSSLWIIDEPYSSLDDDAIKIFDLLLTNHLKSNGCLIMTNHKAIGNTFKNLTNIGI